MKAHGRVMFLHSLNPSHLLPFPTIHRHHLAEPYIDKTEWEFEPLKLLGPGWDRADNIQQEKKQG
jgi:hypothetical protein